MTAAPLASEVHGPVGRSGGGHLSVRGLTVQLRGAGDSGPLTVLDGIDLDVRPGELVTVLGPSGCGKSTLLTAVAGLAQLTAGAIEIDGAAVTGPHPRVGLVFQQNTLFPWKTVQENIAFGLKMRGVGRNERRDAAQELLGLVGLSGFGRHYPAQLSGGMQQRVEIARVLINQPSVILLDEPFASLDAQTRVMMQQLFLEIASRVGLTAVFVTHDIDEALFLGDRVLIMTHRPGRIREVLPVPIPRPRTAELTTDAVFLALKRRCLATVRHETLTALAATTARASESGGRG